MNRRASVLIVVVGLAALLLSMFMVIYSLLQVETDDGVLILRDAQARIMLPSALSFIMESARLGQHIDGETLGWTDVRTGAAGPRAVRSRGQSSIPQLSAATGPYARRHSVDNWPLPGSHYRAHMFSWKRPPLAMRSNAAPNPIRAKSEWLNAYETADDPMTTLLAKMIRPQRGGDQDSPLGLVPANDTSLKANNWYWTGGTNAVHPILTDLGIKLHWQKVWDLVLQDYQDGKPGYHGLLGSQPVADNWSAFIEGDRQPVIASQDRGWFRIYREQASDHDGKNGPWFDRMALSGHGIFIISCGAGATRGYRDWAEVQAFGVQDVFLNDPEYFKELRQQERIHWYRVEWSAFTGGGVNAHEELGLTKNILGNADKAWSNIHLQRAFAWSVGKRGQLPWKFQATANAAPSTNLCGTIKWIDKLEHEPTSGPTPGTGQALW